METGLFQHPALLALFFGLLSAVSLPLGAWVGLLTKPSEKVNAGIMAFGAGSLLAALTLELVHEAIEKLHGGFWPLGLGCILGGLAFVFLNQLLNNKGGFLRKAATLMRHVTKLKRAKVSVIVEELSRVPLFKALPPEEISALVPAVKEIHFEEKATVVREGDKGDFFFIVKEGNLAVTKDGKAVSTLGPGEIFGEMALLTSETRSATVTTQTKARVLQIHKNDFDRLLKASSEVAQEVHRIVEARRKNLDAVARGVDSEEWAKDVQRNLVSSAFHPDAADLQEAITEGKKSHGGAPMAIWLGILLDGIPESAVIGANMAGGSTVSLALIAGLFLANFPESMSSAVGMRKLGMSRVKISWLWGSLCLLTGLGALIGHFTFQGASPATVAFFESLAAGAMLAMIAETMVPEAYEQGGAIVGMCNILGFLSIIFVKTLS